MAANEIQGLDDVLKRMESLTGKEMIKAIRGGLTRSARIPRDAARAKARQFDDPNSPSNIAKNIVTRAGGQKADAKEGGVVVKVGVRGGARPRKGRADTGHFRLVEFGVPALNIPARPFLRPALSENVQKITNDFAGNLDQAITKVLKKR